MILFIVNNSAGTSSVQRKFKRLIKKLGDSLDFEIYYTTKRCDIYYKMIDIEKRYEKVFILGGDGSINEAINGMIEGGKDIPIGIIPAGTVNDFSKYIGVKSDIAGLYDYIIDNEIIEVDVGKINDKCFINVAAAGFISDIGHKTDRELKKRLGKLAYFYIGFLEVFTKAFEKTEFIIEINDKKYEFDAYMFLLMNTSSVGGIATFSPYSNINDGYFDLIVIKKSRYRKALNIFFEIMTGDHIGDDDIFYAKVNNIKISSPKEFDVDVDGEYGGKLPIEFKVIPKRVKVLIPKVK